MRNDMSPVALPSEELCHLRLYAVIHFDQRRPGSFEAFACEFFRRVDPHLGSDTDFIGGVIEHIGRSARENRVTLRIGVRANSK